jgi:hypothetical protein
MTHVFERLLLHCPYANARDYLPKTLETDDAHVLPLEKRMLVRYKRSRNPLHFEDPWHVYWSAEGGNAYPEFHGDLIVRADEHHPGAVLELFGEYAPPFESAVVPADIVTGARKASVTARALLERIGADIEARYNLDEAERWRGATSGGAGAPDAFRAAKEAARVQGFSRPDV